MDESQNNKNPMMIGIALVALLVIGIIFLQIQRGTQKSTVVQNTQKEVPTSDLNETRLTDSELVEGETVDNDDTSEVTSIQVEGGSFYYKPNEIRVKAGQPVKIVLTSADMMHDFVIDELNVKLPITRAGQTNTVEFTPTKPGTYEFYCSVGNHRQQGQVGKLIVE
jgi:heme/copper-type cytochrome/quinol oxidase subunit 2